MAALDVFHCAKNHREGERVLTDVRHAAMP
jgi:hypothetical protein